MPVEILQKGLLDYHHAWQAMREYTHHRSSKSVDQLWVLQHLPVYTQGQAGKPEHILFPSTIPVIETDRGGQVTYHGPGQLVMYPLIELKRYQLGVRKLVTLLESTVIEYLSEQGITALARRDAPGVYINDAKIAAVGLRISRGCSYHGLSMNVDMDLSPFEGINPCGYEGLQVTQLSELGIQTSVEALGRDLADRFVDKLSS